MTLYVATILRSRGPRTRHLCIIRDFIRNADSQTPLQANQIIICILTGAMCANEIKEALE